MPGEKELSWKHNQGGNSLNTLKREFERGQAERRKGSAFAPKSSLVRRARGRN